MSVADAASDDVSPDFVVLGHLVLDRTPQGYILGGTTAYAALTASRLGYRAAIVTAGAPDQAEVLRAEQIAIASAPSSVTTVFENVYHDGRRQQFLRSLAERLTPGDIPQAWRAAPIVHLGPLAQELDASIAGNFPGALVGATPQGWLRQWGADGRVSPTAWRDADAALAHIDALVFSDQDVGGDVELVERYARMARLAVVTRGRDGCVVYAQGQVRSFSAYPATETEPTGAGDVFASAFFLEYWRSGDPWGAADWANCVASFAVEGPGISAIPTLGAVEERKAHAGAAASLRRG